jgi:hypothetical protein
MNKCLSLVHLITISFVVSHLVSAQTELPQARIVNLSVDPEQVLVLHVRPGYVSSVRVLEEVSSVVLGDPGSFKAEHSEAEPQLVFFKATTAKPAQTNALITTKGGREISLSLVSRRSRRLCPQLRAAAQFSNHFGSFQLCGRRYQECRA